MNPDDVVIWLRRAYREALQSPDPSTQNGAIVIGIGGQRTVRDCNSFTAGITPTDDLFERPKKYAFIEHAERNAIYKAAYMGIRPHTLVCPWACCADCARAVVQSGVRVLVRHRRDDETGRWGESIEWGDQILKAGGVEIIEHVGLLGDCAPVLFAGHRMIP